MLSDVTMFKDINYINQNSSLSVNSLYPLRSNPTNDLIKYDHQVFNNNRHKDNFNDYFYFLNQTLLLKTLQKIYNHGLIIVLLVIKATQQRILFRIGENFIELFTPFFQFSNLTFINFKNNIRKPSILIKELLF
jgi:hypothetical protein